MERSVNLQRPILFSKKVIETGKVKNKIFSWGGYHLFSKICAASFLFNFECLILISMKQRYFLQLSYKGTNYHGWQIQPNAISVQEIMEKTLSTLLREKIVVTGADKGHKDQQAVLVSASHSAKPIK